MSQYLAGRENQVRMLRSCSSGLESPKRRYLSAVQAMESFVYGEMVEKMRKYHMLKCGKEPGYTPKLTAARVALAKTESEIEKFLDTLSGATPLFLQYANNRIEELDAERQRQLKLVADLTANSVSDTQID